MSEERLERTRQAYATCGCESPIGYTRPSGKVICQTCGGDIVPKKQPEPRP